MPNHQVAAGIVVISVAVAAAIAVYESPQARQFAEDVRRRIAVALHSLGDEINPQSQNPQSQQPRFNRPEDAEGFMQSGVAPGVDADEESKRRQREELMYWNAVHLEKQAKDRKLREASSENEKRPRNKSQGSSFDDFLQADHSAEKGTFVYNTGADVSEAEQGLRQRGMKGLNRGSVYANPFADENNIDMDEQRAVDISLMSPEPSEESEDLYCASPRPVSSPSTTATMEPQLIDTSDAVPDPPVSYPMMEESHESLSFTNMSPREDSAYASIHAWADANQSFYSPLPATPGAVTPQQETVPVPSSPLFSDPPESVPGDITPTDSMSIADSGENVWAPRSGATSDADVMSMDGDGFVTPDSWTEVGSVVSENDVGTGVHH
ncbi:hypothetical protein D0Z07_4490 [Hyphodiscus hymeniophilus]|uniref:Uncharacterized protein n=1 Tax=Hyphodiscus hymeniophilus TaxID=353542 RepID=A0A9P6VJN3_9HELO|nr:hypothetical protein D0Z07_4490 [Hyphodiscus hymeniophilus]